MSASKAIAKPAAAQRPVNVRARRKTVHGKTFVIEVINFKLDPEARIGLIRQGIPASMIASLSRRMDMSKENLLSYLGLPRATISRKERDAALLSKDESERVLGIETLISIVQTMVEESGDPAGFDAARWVSQWLTKPLPALGGATPASYMDTFEGQKLVSELLSMSQSGAYA